MATVAPTASNFYINKPPNFEKAEGSGRTRITFGGHKHDGPPNIEMDKKPPKKPPDPESGKYAGDQRVAWGAANVTPGQQRSKVNCNSVAPSQRVPASGKDNKVKWKRAALDQRVPGKENHDKQKYSAPIQRVPGQELRNQNGLREGVLDTLSGSMHSDWGPNTGSTQTIKVPVIGY